MDNLWITFKNFYNNETTARLAFEEACTDIFEKHYPNQKIEPYRLNFVNTIRSHAPEKEPPHMILHCKFVFDSLNNSRKGQVRKAFQNSVETLKNNQIPVSEWLFCVPNQLNEEEKNWWESWSNRVTIENNIHVELYEGERLITLLQKYFVFGKWFPNIVNNTEKSNNELKNQNMDTPEKINESVELEIVTPQINEAETTSEHVAETASTPEVHNEIQVQNTSETPKVEQPVVVETTEASQENEKGKLPELVETPISKDEPLHLGSTIDIEFSSEGKTKEFVVEEESGTDDILDDIILDLESHSDIEKEDIVKLEEILAHAKEFEANDDHEKALQLYQYAETWFTDTIEQKSEAERLRAYCEKRIKYNTTLKDADALYVKKDFQNALNLYEEALMIDASDKETVQRYNQCFGDLLTTQKNYRGAECAYIKAIEIGDREDALIQKKVEYSKIMEKSVRCFTSKPASLLNPIVAPYYRLKAAQVNPESTEAQAKSQKTIFTGILIAGALVVLVGLFFLWRTIDSCWVGGGAKTPLTEYEMQLQLGDGYAQRITPATVQYYDSAIVAYKKAIKYEPTKSIAANKMMALQEAKDKYRRDVQANIKSDSAKYFLSMRRPTEGLRLFKYMYEPKDRSKGKFGFVDDNMNVVVAPVFDFNYKKMKDAGETFENGKAKVCIIVSKGDTAYFFINKNGERIDE